MEVIPLDLWILLLACVRYSMGRRTYMTSYAPEMVQRYKEVLSDAQLLQVGKEVDEELRIRKGVLGDQCDTDSWKQFSLWCVAEVERRKEEHEE